MRRLTGRSDPGFGNMPLPLLINSRLLFEGLVRELIRLLDLDRGLAFGVLYTAFAAAAVAPSSR